MKYFFPFCLCVFSICASAQQFDFFKYIAANGVFNNVDTCLDSGYLLSGGTDGPNGGNYVLAKTDSNGNVLWTSVGTRFTGMPGVGSNLITKSIQATDGSYYLGGNITTNTGTQVYFVKLDSMHTLEWDTIITNLSVHTELTDMLLMNDSLLVFTGVLCDSGAYCNFFIGKFNANTQQVTNFNAFDFGNTDEARNLFYYDNSFILSGSSYNVNQPDSNRVAALKVDSSLIEIWRFDSVFAHAFIGKSAFDFYNKELYFPVFYTNVSANANILVIDSMGNYSRTIVADTSELFAAISLDSNSDIIFSNGRLGFRKYDSVNGNLLWSLDTSATIIYQQSVMQIMRDKKGDFVFCGFESEAGHPPASYIGKIRDSNTSSISDISSYTSFLLYPNPVATSTNIYSFQPPPTTELVVFSISGSELMHEAIHSSVTNLDISSFTSGIYIFKIVDIKKKQTLQYGKIIKL